MKILVLASLLLTGCSLAFASAAGEKGSAPQSATPDAPSARTDEYRARAERELRGNILPFWMKHVVDREQGGFFGEISHDLVVKKNAVRGSLLTSRLLWTYSAAYRHFKDPAYLEMARWAFEDLKARFWDPEFGGVYWTAKADGAPLNTRKQVYGQVFALYAMSEYHRATQDSEALEKAVKLYRLLEDHARDPKHGGYFEVCARNWQREKEPSRSAMEAYGAKSQNTHLHVLEAFTSLLRVWPDAGLRRSQTEMIDLMLTRILNAETHHLHLFLTEDWKPVTDEISFGHDIEASWLLTEAAEVLGDETVSERVKPVAVRIAEVTRREGIAADGSLLYEADPHGITVDAREWWPQAEAAVGFLNAYQLSGDKTHLQTAFAVWDYIERHLVDRKYGEWYRAVSAKGVPSTQPKVSLWKCSYHNGRACLELMERLEKLGAKSP